MNWCVYGVVRGVLRHGGWLIGWACLLLLAISLLANVKVHMVHVYAVLYPTNACSYCVSATMLGWEGE
jgi:hypothetical protein